LSQGSFIVAYKSKPLTGQSDLYHKSKAGRETRPIEGLAGDAVIWQKLATIDAISEKPKRGAAK
jgi:hypothetical protein